MRLDITAIDTSATRTVYWPYGSAYGPATDPAAYRADLAESRLEIVGDAPRAILRPLTTGQRHEAQMAQIVRLRTPRPGESREETIEAAAIAERRRAFELSCEEIHGVSWVDGAGQHEGPLPREHWGRLPILMQDWWGSAALRISDGDGSIAPFA